MLRKSLAESLEYHVSRLAGYIGERNPSHPEALDRAALYIEESLRAAGYETRREEYPVGRPDERGWARNLVAETRAPGAGEPFLLIGAHYDTAPGTPGADDNASGTAALIELASELGRRPPKIPVRFAAFSTEEPPYFGTGEMGSAAHARRARERKENISGMLSLEMLGYFDDRPGSQSYPPLLSPFFPDTGDFLALVSNLGSLRFHRKLASGLRREGLKLEAAALPSWVPGVGLSDQRCFWKEGYPAAMLTDTAFYRNPHYHEPTDLPATLDYRRLAETVIALARTLRAWNRTEEALGA